MKCVSNEPVSATRITDYLVKLSAVAGSTTYQSHKTALAAYERWCACKGVTPEEAQHTQAARFLESRFSDCGHSLETVYGHLCTLSNYHAVTNRADPELEKIRIATQLDVSTSSPVEGLQQRVFVPFSASNSPNGTPDWAVDELFAHLRQRRYGTRTHVVTAVLADTKGQVRPVRELDTNDINIEAGTTELPVPEQFLVSKAGLLTTRTANLSTATLDALAAYLKYERCETHDTDASPVFVTSQGRASASTLRRAIRRESKTALASRSGVTEQPELDKIHNRSEVSRSVYLSDIRWAAIKSWLGDR